MPEIFGKYKAFTWRGLPLVSCSKDDHTQVWLDIEKLITPSTFRIFAYSELEKFVGIVGFCGSGSKAYGDSIEQALDNALNTTVSSTKRSLDYHKRAIEQEEQELEYYNQLLNSK